MSAPRLALIGARRVRQGLGPFVARILRDLGAEVCAFVGTSDASRRAAAQDLAEVGVDATPYANVDALLEHEAPDALAILSPPWTHEGFLAAALEAGIPTLCEKPFLWGPKTEPTPGPDDGFDGSDGDGSDGSDGDGSDGDGSDGDGSDGDGSNSWEAEGLGARGRELWRGFAERGVLLRENCQWPQVLPAFWELHQDGAGEPLREFSMRLSPASSGEQMIGDALPHALSLLQALSGEAAPDPQPRLADLRFSTRAPDAEELQMEFVFETPDAPGGLVPARVELIRSDSLPREAALTINGRSAVRRVRLEDYAQFLGYEGREVLLRDPLELLLEDFLSDLEAARAGSPPAPDHAIPTRIEMLEHALRTFREDPL